MNEQNEVWDLYDKDLNFRGTFIKGKGKIPDGFYHKTVEVIPTDMKGNMLLTRRSMLKTSGAGLLEFPAGSVMSGETEEAAALRELKEETGLDGKELFMLQRVRTKGLFRYTYLAYVPDLMTAEISYPLEEVMGHIFVTFEKWQDIITTSAYNSKRAYYSDKLFDLVNKLVHKKVEKVKVTVAAPKQHPPLNKADGLKNRPKNNDLGYNENSNFHSDDWEPDFEQGDDGA